MRPNFKLVFLLAITITVLFCSPSLFANNSVGKSSASTINHNNKDKGKKLTVATYDVAPKLNTNDVPNTACDLKLSLDLAITGLHLNFTNQSIGDYSQVEWNFGDGTMVQSPNAQHTYAQSGMYYVTVSIFNAQTSCMDFIGANIYVNKMGNIQTFTQTDFQAGHTLNLH